MYLFENDVKIYGIQTSKTSFPLDTLFENDVKIYGIQTRTEFERMFISLRMM